MELIFLARSDPHNQSHLWADPDMAGLMMMRADFTTHGYAPHFHEELVIAVTERGGSEFRSRGICEQAEPGTVLVFNPGEPHSGRMGWSERWRYRAFYLGDVVLEQFAEDLDVMPEALPHFLENKLQDRRLCQSFLALHSSAEHSGSILQKQTELLSVLANLFVTHGTPAPKLQGLGNEQSRISEVLQYLSDNYEDNVTLNELAQLSDMSTFHLIRSFNKAVGLSPYAFLTQVRVRRAREMLETGAPLAEVAAAVGLYDQSALNRHFKRVYGVTPGQYAGTVRHQVIWNI